MVGWAGCEDDNCLSLCLLSLLATLACGVLFGRALVRVAWPNIVRTAIWFRVQAIVWGRTARHVFMGLGSNPVAYARTQVSVWNLLQLEANHLRDFYWSRWLGLEGDDAYKGGLKHVDTARTGIPKKAAKVGGSEGGMGAKDVPVVKDVVLIGGGHAHAYVLKNFGMNPLPGVQLTLISRDIMTPYSGMLPGHVAGLYTAEECHIDLVRLARFAGARLVHAEACGIHAGTVMLKGDRPSIAFDVLSIDIGSSPRMAPVLPPLSARTDADESTSRTSEEPDLEEMKVVELRQLLKSRGLATTGRKAELILRLQENISTPAVPGELSSTGATPSSNQGHNSGTGSPSACVTPVKPIDGFSARWTVIVQRVLNTVEPVALVVVGGGAGGVELALSIHARLRRDLAAAGKDPDLLTVTLVTRGGRIMSSHSTATTVVFNDILASRGITVLLNHAVERVVGNVLECVNDAKVPFDECIWCTQAGAQSWLRDASPLDLDDNGFIRVSETLESTNVAGVFAAGDIASLPEPRAKAGVFAVRAGPVLTGNIRRAVLGRREELQPYHPQRTFLGIISTGSPEIAVASMGSMALPGRWVWELKDWIDRKWMAGYSHDLPDMSMTTPEPPEVARNAGPDALHALAHASMRCGGCGAKVGATVLSRVLARLQDRLHVRPEVLVGLNSPDDCAVVAPEPKMASVHTVDFFRSFTDDPFVFGRIAANHALSDCHAMCAEARTALAVAVVPFAVEEKVEEVCLLL